MVLIEDKLLIDDLYDELKLKNYDDFKILSNLL
jgi:hypothetical protein